MKFAKMKYLVLLAMALSLLTLSIPMAGVSAAAAPVVISINPHVGMQGTVLNNATITGTDLNGATSIFFSDSGVSANITSSSSSQILVNIGILSSANVGTVDVHVTTSGGGEGNDTFNAFTVVSSLPPTVSSLSRSSGAQGAVIKGVIITGTHLFGATGLTFSTGDITGSDVVPIDDNSISATITIAAGAPLGPRNVTIITPAGPGTKNSAFSVIAPKPPTITSISPGLANDTGVKQPMLITGTDFEGAIAVNISGNVTITDINNPAAISGLSIFDDTRIILNYNVDTGAAPGPRDISVTTPSGTSNAKVLTIYNATVSVSSPGGVTAGGNFFVYINISSVAQLNSSQFDLSYNPARIEVVGAEGGTGVSDGLIGGQTFSKVNWGFIPPGTAGVMRVEGHNNGINSVSGAGYLARIQFHYIGSADTSTSLNLLPQDAVEPHVILGLILANAEGNNVPAATKNGSIASKGPVIDQLVMPEATLNKAYPPTGSVTASAAGGTGAHTWSAMTSLGAGSPVAGLPPGLSLNAATGAITGTPTAAGDFTVSLIATDSATPTPNSSTMGGIDLYVWPSLSVTTSSLPVATVGNAYFKPVAATGGKPQYTWSATGLPGGLTIGPGTGIISGTPTVSGNFSAAITVADSFNPPNTSTRNLTLNVNPVLQISNLLTTLPAGNKDSLYAPFTVTATGGNGSYTWSAAGLPNGLSIGQGTGIISGTPTLAGDFNNIVVTVTDTVNGTANKTFTLHVNGPLAINTTALNDAVVGIPYSFDFTAGGGAPSYSWAITAGILPANLTMGSTGHIGGTPAAAGNSPLTVKVTDSVNANVSANFTLHVYAPLQITPTSLPDAMAGQVYSVTLNATGGNLPYSWTVTGLPANLTFNSATRVISGTPAAAGTPTITINVTDSANPPNTATINPVLHVYAPLQVTPPALPDAMVAALYSMTLSATGGKPLYAWNAVGLPGTLTLTPSADTLTATINGTPTAAATGIAITITVTDSASPANVVTLHLTLNIYPALVINTSSLPRSAIETGSKLPDVPGWVLGVPYTGVTFSAGGGKPGYTWSATNLPPGVSLNATSGLVAGTPTVSGNFDITFTVTDSASPAKSVSKILSLKIYKPGDANGDGVVTVLDITYGERVLFGLNAPTAGSDANLNGIFNTADIVRIEKLIINPS